MRPIALAAIRGGLVDQDTLRQFKRWGAIPRDTDVTVVEDPLMAVELMREALEAESVDRLLTTDLDIYKFYLKRENQVRGTIVLVNDVFGTKGTKAITFAKRKMNNVVEYIIPWTAESIEEIITNGSTYLRYNEDGVTVKTFFNNVEEMFFGDIKAFMVCSYRKDANVDS